MLSISQTEVGFYCFEWIPTEKGPKIVNYSCVNNFNDFAAKDTLQNVIKSFNPQHIKQSKSLSLSLSLKEVKVDHFKCDENLSVEKSIKWYESNIFDESFIQENDIYYYPVNIEKNKLFLVLSINKKNKQNIIASSKDLGYNLIYLTVDLFSAAVSAKQIYNLSQNEEFLIWKVLNNNCHDLVCYKNDKLDGFFNLQIKKNKYMYSCSISSSETKDKINHFIENTIINKKKSRFENVFVYQNKKDFKFIKSIIANKQLNVKLLSISRIFLNNKKQIYKNLPYVEGGLSLRGIDV